MISNSANKITLSRLLELMQLNWVRLETKTTIETKTVRRRYHMTLKIVFVITIIKKVILQSFAQSQKTSFGFSNLRISDQD